MKLSKSWSDKGKKPKKARELARKPVDVKTELDKLAKPEEQDKEAANLSNLSKKTGGKK